MTANFDARLAEALKARDDADRIDLGKKDDIQGKYFNLLADELTEICGNNPAFGTIKERVKNHFNSLWKSMAGAGSKTRIVLAFERTINRMSSLLDDSKLAERTRNIAEGKICRSCLQKMNGGGESGKRSSSKKRHNDDYDDGRVDGYYCGGF